MPPPWLINMQRYGPPPGYPQLKIPGVNAPIPEGAQWGYQPGGWGKAPVNEVGSMKNSSWSSMLTGVAAELMYLCLCSFLAM